MATTITQDGLVDALHENLGVKDKVAASIAGLFQPHERRVISEAVGTDKEQPWVEHATRHMLSRLKRLQDAQEHS